MPDGGHTITVLLDRWRDGDDEAPGELMPLVYEEQTDGTDVLVACRLERGGRSAQ